MDERATVYLKQLESIYPTLGAEDKQRFRMGAEGAIGALVAVGVLDPGVAAEWQIRFTALVREPATPSPSSPRPPARETATRLLGRELIRVVVPTKPAIRGPVRVTSVELYSSGVVIRWVQAENAHPTATVITEALRRCELSDDLGTAYSSLGGGSHGDPSAIRGDIGFLPAVPEGTTQLTVTFGAVGSMTIPIA